VLPIEVEVAQVGVGVPSWWPATLFLHLMLKSRWMRWGLHRVNPSLHVGVSHSVAMVGVRHWSSTLVSL
jgi:hypothetical protein